MAETTPQRPREQSESTRARLLAALKSRGGLRQAVLLAEVLMPPLAKRKARAPSNGRVGR